jgi:hypothetical protein
LPWKSIHVPYIQWQYWAHSAKIEWETFKDVKLILKCFCTGMSKVSMQPRRIKFNYISQKTFCFPFNNNNKCPTILNYTNLFVWLPIFITNLLSNYTPQSSVILALIESMVLSTIQFLQSLYCIPRACRLGIMAANDFKGRATVMFDLFSYEGRPYFLQFAHILIMFYALHSYQQIIFLIWLPNTQGWFSVPLNLRLCLGGNSYITMM